MTQINVFTDIDSLWDTRRAVLETLLPEGETWEGTYARTYKDRTIDMFAKPGLGITQESYEAAFKKRSIDLFTQTVYPTNLLNRILTIILDIENFTGKPISLGRFLFTVNLYPYDIPDDLKVILEDSISKSIVYDHEINFVNVPPSRMDAPFFRSFSHVFKYDILGEGSLALVESLKNSPIPSVKFFLPDLYQKDPGTEIVADPEEIIHKMSLILGSAITLIPAKHRIYDYRGS